MLIKDIYTVSKLLHARTKDGANGTIPLYLTLKALSEMGEDDRPCRSILTNLTSIDRSTMSVILRRAEERGETTSVVHPDSGRSKMDSITPKGRARLKALEKVLAEEEAKTLARLSNNDAKTLPRIVAGLLESLKAEIRYDVIEE